MQGTTYSGKMRSPAALVPEGRKSLSVAFRRKNIIRQRKKKKKNGEEEYSLIFDKPDSCVRPERKWFLSRFGLT